MKPHVAGILVVHLPSFKGTDTIVVSCSRAGLQSLIHDLANLSPTNGSSNHPLVIGQRPQIISDVRCIVTVAIGKCEHTALTRDAHNSFLWQVDLEGYEDFLDKISAMSEYGRPCHQYFEPNASEDSPIIMVSLLEYEDDLLLGAPHDDRSEMTPSEDTGLHRPSR